MENSNQKINSILEDLYGLDPSFRNHEEYIKKIINDLLEIKPEVKVDKTFVDHLRGELNLKISQMHKRANESFFMRVPEFVYIFGGAVVVLLMFYAVGNLGLFFSDTKSSYLYSSGTGSFSGEGFDNIVSEANLTDRKIVKNGSLWLLVKAIDDVAESIRNLAVELGGFVADFKIYEVAKDTKSGEITIRVPADRFDEAMSELKKLAIKIEREDTDAKDVTEQFIDLESRLRNLQAEEAQYLSIMRKALTIEDILKVSGRLDDVRSRIEDIQGQLKYLSRQVDMSSITINLTSEENVEILGIRWQPLFAIKQTFRNMLIGFTHYIDVVLSFLLYVPLILVWGATFFVLIVLGWKVFQKVQNKFFKD